MRDDHEGPYTPGEVGLMVLVAVLIAAALLALIPGR